MSNKQGVIIFSNKLTEEQAVKRASMDDDSITEAAMYLRSIVKKMKGQLPAPFTVDALKVGYGKHQSH